MKNSKGVNNNNNNNNGFCSPDRPRSKIERKWKKDKYLDLARELKKLLNMKVTVTLIVIGALGKSTKGWYRDWRTWK